MRRRFAYWLIGFAFGSLVAGALDWELKKPFGARFIGIAVGCGSVAVAMAEKKGKVKSIEDINRPLTLFPPDTPGK